MDITQPYQVITITALGSPYRYVLRGGQDIGIQKGQLFYVLDREIQVHDPDTNELLDTFTIIKMPLEVVEVRDHVSMCDPAMPKLPDGWRAGHERVEVGDIARPLPPLKAEERVPLWKRLFHVS